MVWQDDAENGEQAQGEQMVWCCRQDAENGGNGHKEGRECGVTGMVWAICAGEKGNCTGNKTREHTLHKKILVQHRLLENKHKLTLQQTATKRVPITE